MSLALSFIYAFTLTKLPFNTRGPRLLERLLKQRAAAEPRSVQISMATAWIARLRLVGRNKQNSQRRGLSHQNTPDRRGLRLMNGAARPQSPLILQSATENEM